MAKPKRPTKRLDADEIATILAYGDIHGDRAAAAEFNVSQRTLQRYRRALRDNRAPELSGLVAETKARAIDRCGDLLTETYGAALRRLKVVLPEATVAEVISAARMLGELHTERKALLGDEDEDEAHRPHGQNSGNAEAQSRAAPTTH